MGGRRGQPRQALPARWRTTLKTVVDLIPTSASKLLGQLASLFILYMVACLFFGFGPFRRLAAVGAGAADGAISLRRAASAAPTAGATEGRAATGQLSSMAGMTPEA